MNLKRGQNQGSIYQRRSDQRWVAQVTDAGKHKLAYFHSQAEAQRWLTFALRQIRLKRPISTRQTLLGVYFEFWLEHMSLTPTAQNISAISANHPEPSASGIRKCLNPGIIYRTTPKLLRP